MTYSLEKKKSTGLDFEIQKRAFDYLTRHLLITLAPGTRNRELKLYLGSKPYQKTSKDLDA